MATVVAVGGDASAQQPTPPAPPPAYGAPISLEQAKAAVAAAEAEAKSNGWKLAIAVIGPNGELVYLQKDDLAPNGSIEIAQGKARTAALFRRSRRFSWIGSRVARPM